MKYWCLTSLLLSLLLLSGCVAVGVAAAGGAVVGYGASHMSKHQPRTGTHDGGASPAGTQYDQDS